MGHKDGLLTQERSGCALFSETLEC
jgi:hypothetical protein